MKFELPKSEEYDEHTVSVKAAIYSHDLKKALLMKYSRGFYGLPGGHLDANEFPDEAMDRELMEELSITVPSLKRDSFYLRGDRGSSVILGYVGIAEKDIVLQPTNPNKEIGVWMTKDEIRTLPNISDNYKEHLAKNWPTTN